ncbi:hypothetical protein B0T17DRAFT_617234 [Bombardia bombarda]|uniref:AAA+ ATPase domain-containing protein n=1 Tax=Bombardia bombarda TaxID=252184 RepID=A0AA39X0P0_9PEZI|nr:hypothetical protein B0T17DRAFT_617234 [Bombardia bombarda]
MIQLEKQDSSGDLSSSSRTRNDGSSRSMGLSTEVGQLLDLQNATDLSQRSPLWRRAWEKYAASLGPKERDAIFNIISSGNVAALSGNDIAQLLGPLRSRYDSSKFEKCRMVIGPVVSRLKAFASIVDVFVQSNPDVSALIWGSVKTLLLTVVQNQSAIDLVAEGLDKISFDLPLFDRWARHFPETEFSELHETLTGVYCHIIGFCVDVISVLNKPPLVNSFRVTLPEILKRRLESMREQIRRLKLQFDTESYENLNTGIQKLLNDGHLKSSNLPTKPIYHVPAYKIPRYFPRQELETNLRDIMSQSLTNDDFNSLCVHGPHGSGKTQLVLEVLRGVRAKFKSSSVLWFQASSMEKVEKEFSRVGEKLGIPVTSNEGGSVIDIVLNWLCGADQPWILVFDNANDHSVLDEVWPNNAPKGLIIAITNDPVAMSSRTASSVHVPLYTLNEGADFLAFHLDKMVGDQARDSEKYPSYCTISKTLGALPLSLSIAANFMSTANCDAEEFIEILKDSPSQLFDASSANPGYNRTIEDILRMSFSGLKAADERLLDILAFFDSDSIPLAMLKSPVLSGYTEYAFMGTPRFRFAYRNLRSRSLIHQNQNSVCFHPFFQEAIITKIQSDKARYQRAFEASLELLLSKFPRHTFSKRRDVESWKLCETYIEHVKFLDRRCPDDKLSNELSLRMARINYQAAWFFFERGRIQRGISTISRSRSFLSEDQPDHLVLLADTYWMQGRFYNQCNQPHRSEPFFAAAIKHAEKAVSLGLLSPSAPASHPFREADPSTQGEMVAMSYTNLGSCLLWEGSLEEAEERLHKVLHLFDRRLECSQYAMANVHLAQGRVQAALDLHREVLNRFMERSGYDHTDAAHSCHKVGVLHHKLGEYDQALVFLSKALDIYETQGRHCDMRPAKARTLWYLSMVMEEFGDEDKSKEMRAEADKLLQEVDVYKDPNQRDVSKMYDELVFFWYR